MLPEQLPGVRGWRPPALSHGLSLAQPWAWCVVHGPRRVENRVWSWPPETVAIWTGARIAIHASKTWDQEGQSFIRSRGVRCPMQVEVPAGAVIGAATIERFAGVGGDDAIAPDQAQWAFGPMQIVLSDVVAIHKPIPCRGFARLWWLPSAVQQDLTEQLREGGHHA